LEELNQNTKKNTLKKTEKQIVLIIGGGIAGCICRHFIVQVLLTVNTSLIKMVWKPIRKRIGEFPLAPAASGAFLKNNCEICFGRNGCHLRIQYTSKNIGDAIPMGK